jgi:hypothetical protein
MRWPGGGLTSFLPRARTGLRNSIRLLVHLWQPKTILSWLMVATQQVGDKMTQELFNKGGLTQFLLAESGGYDLCQKLLWPTLSYKLFSSRHDIKLTTESTMVVWPNNRLTNYPNIQTIPNQVTVIVWGSMPLIIVSTTVMTVLRSIEVVYIPHESRLSLVARHPLIRWNTFTHFQGVR